MTSLNKLAKLAKFPFFRHVWYLKFGQLGQLHPTSLRLRELHHEPSSNCLQAAVSSPWHRSALIDFQVDKHQPSSSASRSRKSRRTGKRNPQLLRLSTHNLLLTTFEAPRLTTPRRQPGNPQRLLCSHNITIYLIAFQRKNDKLSSKCGKYPATRIGKARSRVSPIEPRKGPPSACSLSRCKPKSFNPQLSAQADRRSADHFERHGASTDVADTTRPHLQIDQLRFE